MQLQGATTSPNSAVIDDSDEILIAQKATARASQSTQRLQCDGRTYCSQMTSLAEARFLTRNCPNTKMDGNRDGEPCERDSRRGREPAWQD